MEKQNVKMEVAELLRNYAGLSEVINEKKVFASEVNLAIAKNSRILENEVKSYQESLKQIIDRYVHKDESGDPETKKQPGGAQEYVFETAEKKKEYLKAVRELECVDIELDISVIKYDSLEESGSDKPTAYDLVALDFMIKE